MIQKKCISYALFGYNKARVENCFDFASYLRGLMINIRMNRLLFPDWEISLQTDQTTFDAFQILFSNIGIKIHVNEPAPLCLAMLWRLKPVFETTNNNWIYSHVLCRDLDSPATYREAQAVKFWMNRDKAMHAITDSVSHCLPLLGGMIGMRPAYFTERMGVKTWEDLIAIGGDMDYSNKGSDQTFLNRFVYPVFGSKGNESITQHYVLGHGDTFLNDFHNHIQDLEIDVPYTLKESNLVCGHIGAAGYYEGAMFQFLRKHWDKFGDLLEQEKNFSKIFYWTDAE